MERMIFLIDMDAFFISCESTRYKNILNKPAVVAGDPKKRSGVVLTASYEARKYGIKTAMVLNQALRLCPNLMVISPDHCFYKEKSDQVIRILSEYTPIIQQNSIDEAWLDMTGCQSRCAEDIINKIKYELGLSCSIGISYNKFLSKMASDMNKPSGITRLWKGDIERKLWLLPVETMYGVGKYTTKKLRNMKINTIGDLANCDENILVRKLGKMGYKIHELANGIDDSPVKPHSYADVKSIGKSITLSHDITDMQHAKTVLMDLSDKVGMAARSQGRKGDKVQICIKYYNFKKCTRQMKIPSTYLVRDIYSAGIELLEKNWDTRMPVRLLGISLSGFSKYTDEKQISIFDISNKNDKYDKVEEVISSIREKYGNDIINSALMINKRRFY